MRGRDLIMWSVGQWEALKKLTSKGDKQHTDFAPTRPTRPRGPSWWKNTKRKCRVRCVEKSQEQLRIFSPNMNKIKLPTLYRCSNIVTNILHVSSCQLMPVFPERDLHCWKPIHGLILAKHFWRKYPFLCRLVEKSTNMVKYSHLKLCETVGNNQTACICLIQGSEYYIRLCIYCSTYYLTALYYTWLNCPTLNCIMN